MKYAVSSEDVIRLFGLDGVNYYPQYDGSELDAKAAEFLAGVGLPTDRTFASRAEPESGFPTPNELGPLFGRRGQACPPERRHWLVLGYLVTALVVLDPRTGTIHVYPEGESDSQLLHRDVESFVFTLCAFRKLTDAYTEDEDQVEEFAYEFRQAVTTVDPTPLADEETEWNRLLDEVLEGMW
ncbi:SUKH-4 immunity protein of toxin-antitoxin system [Streptomyces puniciscabiei]|uniref:SUKH-4 immunity protein of toxin-antitoxin system n=1 Tax=Streptomyces puniciscabiei TaxID=164348 RepID=A0A542UE34_9ACTN|nr:SUKH-4 family immunity protein [Streptomyces puniciscabiei]TQK97335.1 SUKH-4 immunity protein of toxin-antitoxin system [Streptomyces puniciscabiei]